MHKRLHAYFKGRVQGVGFRFTTIELARELEVNGWARNLDDGRVEVTAEGEEEDIKELVDEISHRFSRFISSVDTDWSDATGEFNDFLIKF
jgi:acylphosphatase